MHTRPRDLDEERLQRFVADRWRLPGVILTHAPVGFGSHHWHAALADGGRRFVTVDDLAGDGHRHERLDHAMRTALALRKDAGLAFVVAPLPAVTGEPVEVLDARWAVTVLPHVDHVRGDRAGAEEVVGLLARLHDATPAVRSLVATDDLAVDARPELERALRDTGGPWRGGRHSEECRNLLRAAADEVRAALTAYDDLAARAVGAERVVTHGEPKTDNVLVTAPGPVLVDWDTVLLAPAARDLWWPAADHPGAARRYADLTGRAVPVGELRLYALRWDLTDVALFVRDLRGDHSDDEDTGVAIDALRGLLRPGNLATRAGPAMRHA